MALLKHLWRNERTRHALIAAALAAVLGGIEFFEPLRPLEWQAQAYIAPRAASGDIIFIEEKEDPNNTASAHARKELASLIESLTTAGAHKIVLNEIFDRPTTAEADEAQAQPVPESLAEADGLGSGVR